MLRSMGTAEKLFDVGVWLVLILTCFAVVVPLWYLVVISVTPSDVWSQTGGSFFISPAKITFEAYEQLLSSWRLPKAFLVSVYITVFGTFLNLVATTTMAYPLAKKRFRWRTPLLLFVLFTILFSGGLIPRYLVVKDLGLINTYWALMLPNLISVFNLLVMKSFFQNIPDEVEDAARIDGASDWQVFWRIVLPLSKPILATVGLFYAVGHWNSFFDAILFISNTEMQPLQVVLRQILSAGSLSDYVPAGAERAVQPESLRMAAVVLTTIPILLVYPFLQRHFTSGVLLGSVKE